MIVSGTIFWSLIIGVFLMVSRAEVYFTCLAVIDRSSLVGKCADRLRCAPTGVRTPVLALRGPCPSPLDDGGNIQLGEIVP